MRSIRTTTAMLVVLLLSLAVAPAFAVGFNESEDVQARSGDPSPGLSESNINDYTFQDEQVNVNVDDGQVRVLRTDQKALMHDFVVGTFPVHNAPVIEMRNAIRAVVRMEGGRADPIRDRVEGEFFLQVIAPEWMMPYVADAVEVLDVEWLGLWNDGSAESYLQMQHRRAVDVDRVASQYRGEGDATSIIDTVNNAVYRLDESFRLNYYHQMVPLIDTPPNQADIEVRIYEINQRDALKVGLDYINWRNGPGRHLFTFIAEGYQASQAARGRTSVYDPFVDARLRVNDGDDESYRTVVDTALNATFMSANYVLSSNFVDFLRTRGVARLMTSQNVLVTSSHQANVVASDELITVVADNDSPGQSPSLISRNDYLTDTDYDYDIRASASRSEGTDNADLYDDGTPAVLPDFDRSVSYARNPGRVGMSMTLNPYIGTDSMELRMEMVMNDMAGLAPNGTPIIFSRSAETTVRLLDGQTFVVAGLHRVTEADSSAKAPWLGSLPVLGYLFGGENNNRAESDLIVTITPRFIMSSNATERMPRRVEALERIVGNDEAQGLPEMSFGYDQWLLGG